MNTPHPRPVIMARAFALMLVLIPAMLLAQKPDKKSSPSDTADSKLKGAAPEPVRRLQRPERRRERPWASRPKKKLTF